MPIYYLDPATNFFLFITRSSSFANLDTSLCISYILELDTLTLCLSLADVVSNIMICMHLVSPRFLKHQTYSANSVLPCNIGLMNSYDAAAIC